MTFSMYLQLFWAYIQIGMFSIGGGHASIPVVQSMIVETKHWMTMAEFSDVIVISEITPGPFGINSATFIGNKLGGIFGGLVATLGCSLPSLIIVIILAIIYKKYRKVTAVSGALYAIRPAATGLVVSAATSLAFLAFFSTNIISQISSVNLIAIALFCVSLAVLKLTKLNPVIVIIMSGVLGGILYSIF